MMKRIETVKKMNRTLLEMHLGILVCGIVCQLIGALLVQEQMTYACSLWFGILLANISVRHMYQSLDHALCYEQEEASRQILKAYYTRYVAVVILFALIMLTKVMNPLVAFLGYMSLKGTAYLQPFTHKLCNKIFHETDSDVSRATQEAVSETEEGKDSSQESVGGR